MVTDAAAVVMVARHMIEGVAGGLRERERPPVHVIPNGYDEEDFRGASPPRLPWFSIVHTGQLRRAPSPLWEGLVRAIRERPELHGQVHVWQIGFVDAAAAPALGAPPDGVHVHVVPPVPQREAIGYMLAADLLLVEEIGQIMPSKTAQYLRAGRPILALLEQGNELRETLEHVSHAYLARREDAGRPTADIVARLAAAPREPARAPDEAVTAFSRRAIARRFAEVLDAACARHAARALNRDGAQPRDAPRLANALARSPRP
jgi:glycosyltransferase involved in cell wall biosynthesis